MHEMHQKQMLVVLSLLRVNLRADCKVAALQSTVIHQCYSSVIRQIYKARQQPETLDCFSTPTLRHNI
jgi:hypothetical protein